MKIIRKILDVAVTLLLVIAIACNTYILIAKKVTGEPQPKIFGYSVAVVVSGSMAETINVNDLIIDKAQEEYSKGDIISFKSGSVVVTHRIVGEENGAFITKGDANNTEDKETVSKENIIGKVVLTVSGVGAVIGFFQTQLGMAVMAIALVVIVFATSFKKKAEEK